ncbi:hypothetical protein DDI_2024 [Dickeya dianthicola RNS04.9]|nr:hypothetical protein DDI_2024 [Dickeya dianthicola RNS04.9]
MIFIRVDVFNKALTGLFCEVARNIAMVIMLKKSVLVVIFDHK